MDIKKVYHEGLQVLSIMVGGTYLVHKIQLFWNIEHTPLYIIDDSLMKFMVSFIIIYFIVRIGNDYFNK